LLQLPTFNELSMVSLLGAVMSVAYCVIAVVSSGPCERILRSRVG
jgi:hypothetical protein